MRKTLLLTLSLLFAASVSATNRNLQEMQKAAWKALSTISTRAQRYNANNLHVLKNYNQIAIIGNDNIGFALITKNNVHQAVLGYSTTPYNEQNTALQWYIHQAQQALNNIHSTSNEINPALYGCKEKVEPFIQTTWSQNEPYNNLCPTNPHKQHYITGCVATAMSQIMRYYQYPTSGQGTNSYGFTPPEGEGDGKNIELDFSKYTYDWKNMLLHYNNKQWNRTQANAVATLMYHCGVAVSMQYSMNFSSAFTREAQNAFVKYFKYDSNANIVARDFFSNQEWMRMVYTELNAKRPIYYTGVDPQSGGHAFVLCGYNQQGLVYVNWGWNGTANGYYDLSILHPQNTTLNYAKWQDMIIGISPTKVTNHQSHICMDHPLRITKFGKNISCQGDYIINRGTAFTGNLAIVMQGNGMFFILNQITIGTQQPLPTYQQLNVPNLFGTFTVPTNQATDGKYYIYGVSKDENDTDWQLIRHWNGIKQNYAGAIIEIKEGRIKSISQITMQHLPTGIVTHKAEPCDITKVYDLRGRKYLQIPTRQFSEHLLPTHATFIIKQGSKVYKIIR